LSDDTAPFPCGILRIEGIDDDGAATLVLRGEFDMSGAVQFWAGISEALATKPSSLTVEARSDVHRCIGPESFDTSP
jgi:hypothetical protein